MYRIFLNAQAQKDLKKLPAAVAEVIKAALLGEFKNNPFSGRYDVAKLQLPYEGYRLRVGEYRILFKVEENFIKVYRIRHRKDAYR